VGWLSLSSPESSWPPFPRLAGPRFRCKQLLGSSIANQAPGGLQCDAQLVLVLLGISAETKSRGHGATVPSAWAAACAEEDQGQHGAAPAESAFSAATAETPELPAGHRVAASHCGVGEETQVAEAQTDRAHLQGESGQCANAPIYETLQLHGSAFMSWMLMLCPTISCAPFLFCTTLFS